MMMTKKERLRRTLRRESVDRLPTQINFTSGMGEKMAAHFDVTAEELPEFLGNHMVRVDLRQPTKVSEDGRVRIDWWGVGFDTKEEGYFAAVNPLAMNSDLDAFPWPNPHDQHLFADAQQTIGTDAGAHFILPNFGFALFERAWSLRGFEQFFIDMAADPVYAGELLDRITEIQLVLINRYLELGVDGGYFGDDYGAQKNLLFSPRMWRKLIKPRLFRLFAPFRDRGLPILMHSDGQIQQILPDLVEIGLTTLNPVQPEVLDHQWLYDNFKDTLTFYGGISTQTVLPNGTAVAVQTAVTDCVRQLAPEGTGLLLAPSHRMMTDIPMANVEALLDVFQYL
jgi:uroporphyrinogen decarboxylase